MASLGHVAIGLCVGRLACERGASARQLLGAMALSTCLSLLPDLDVIAFALGVPYSAPFGHRGASHSLLAAVAGGVLAGLLWTRGRRNWRAVALGTLALASHGLLDTLTDGGLGVALLWPWSDTRYFAPVRPLPVAPIGARLFSARGWSVMGTELLLFMPCWLYALWPRRRHGREEGGPVP